MRPLIILTLLLSGCSMTPQQRHAFGQAMYEAGQQIQRQEAMNQPPPMPQTTTTSCRQNGSQVWCSSSTF